MLASLFVGDVRGIDDLLEEKVLIHVHYILSEIEDDEEVEGKKKNLKLKDEENNVNEAGHKEEKDESFLRKRQRD